MNTEQYDAVPVRGTGRYELGEGPRWIGDELLFVDILGGRLFGLAPSAPPERAEPAKKDGPVRTSGWTEPRTVLRVDHPLGAVAPVADDPGAYVAAVGTGIALLRPGLEHTRIEWRGRPEDGAAVPMRMNDGCCDPRGRFWAGSMAYDTIEGAGSLYRAGPDGGVDRVLEGYTIPNGPAFHPDGSLMYLADSAAGRVDVYALDHRGDPVERSVFAQVEGGSPDGMQVDAEGFLWVAVWGSGRVHRYAPDGTLERVVAVPAVQPSSVCVVGGGEHGGEPTLFITSARIGLGQPGPNDGAVFAAPAPAPAGPALPFGPLR